LVAGPREPPLKRIAITLPDLVSVLRGRSAVAGVVVGAGTRRVQFSARLVGRTLTITLRHPTPYVRITIGHELLAVSKPVAQNFRKRRLKRIVLVIVATEAGGKRTRLTVRVSAR
jgi:hypothetical protein